MSWWTTEQLASFERDGFVVQPALFDAVDVAEMQESFEALAGRARRLAREYPQNADDTGPWACTHAGSQFVLEGHEATTRIHRVVWCGGAAPRLLAFGARPELVGRAAELLVSDTVVQLINQAHFKLPGDAVEFDWHQDSRHRRYGTPMWTDVSGRGSFVQCFTAVDRADEDNGALRVIPGSHRLGHVATGADDRLPSELVDTSAALVLTMNPGDTVFFGPYLVHGSDANRSARPRRAFINGYALPGANRRRYPGCGLGRELVVERA